MSKEEEETSNDEDEPFIRSFELNFHGWNLGGKLIFIATILAILSLLLPWIGENAETEMGFRQGGSIFLALYIYPFFILAQDKSMNKIFGGISSLFAVLLPGFLLYYMSRERIKLPMMEIMDWGLILFMIAGVLLLIGVAKYERYHRHEPKKDLEKEREGKEKRGKPCPECDSPMIYEEEWDRWYCEECDKYQ